MQKNSIPEHCCAHCRHLLDYPKNNTYGDVEHLCVRIGMFIIGIYKDLDNVKFLMGDGKTPDPKAAAKCMFEESIQRIEKCTHK